MLLARELVGKHPEYPLDLDGHLPEDGRDEAPAEGLILPKQYMDGDINLLGIYGVSPRNGGVVAPYCYAVVFEKVEGGVLDNEVGHRRVHIADVKTVDSESGPDGYDEFVLVGNIKNMQAIKNVVPSRVRLQVAEFLGDFFAGNLYLSVCENRFKTLRSFAKGKLDLVRDRAMGTQDIPSHVIEGGSEIVNGIADDEREMIGNGRVYFSDQGALAGMSIVVGREPASLAIVQSLGLGNKILDVMLGPL